LHESHDAPAFGWDLKIIGITYRTPSQAWSCTRSSSRPICFHEDVRRAIPFSLANARRVRIIGFIALAQALTAFLLSWKASFLAGGYIPENLRLYYININISFFLPLVILVIAEVLRMGAKIEEERALTI